MKFVHTADLQIGARFTLFGEKAEILRAARLLALDHILQIARENDVDVVLIAGDMFESNQIANSIVDKAFAILAAYPDVPIVILPGNHDPLTGPGCIWMRKPFASPPPHVTVCSSRTPVEIAGAVILPVPITQKISSKDPSLPLVDMAADIDPGKIKIGMTHGALAIEGKHQPSDQPIALDAATRAGLDYLAVGHWHKPQTYDDGRLSMSGTPEPDDFGQDSGSVSLIEISAPERTPSLRRLNSATLSWRSVTVDLLNRQSTNEVFAEAISGNDTPPDSTVLRIELKGPGSPEYRESLESKIFQSAKDYAAVLLDDRTSTAISESLWNSYLQEHPLLAQVVADVERSRLFNTGTPPAIDISGLDELTISEFQSFCSDLKIEADQLGEDAFEAMTALLTSEVGQAEKEGGA